VFPLSPRLLSVGLPVFNGENYLESALDSVLSQTFDDFELVVSDNASTDRTAELVLSRASADDRIRYVRHPENLGAAPNYNSTLAMSEASRYYVWIAHDDVLYPRFFEVCIDALEADPAAVLSFTKTVSLDQDAVEGEVFASRPALEDPGASVRFADAINQRRRNYPVFGVMRRSALDRTHLHGSYTGSDRTLVAEMALQGPFIEVDEVLFGLREHEEKSVRQGSGAGLWGRDIWFDTANAEKITLPRWRRFGYYILASVKLPANATEKIKCVLEVARWLFDRNWKTLTLDLVKAARQAAVLLRGRKTPPSV